MSAATTPFQPKFMRVGVLTAALQELTPRDVRDADPDRAIEDWLQFALEIGASYIQLSAALHPSQADVPPEAMLDPVANTLDLRQPFDRTRAARVLAAVANAGVGLSDLAYFDNLLHHDPATRKSKHDFLLRVFDAAVAWDSIFHVPREDHGALFARIARWLRPGGRALLSLGGSDGSAFTAEMFGETFHYSGHAPERARALLCDAGFSIEHWEVDDPSSRGHIAIIAAVRSEVRTLPTRDFDT